MQRLLCLGMFAALVLAPQAQAQGNKKPQKGKVEAPSDPEGAAGSP